jgi:hypothetical protein
VDLPANLFQDVTGHAASSANPTPEEKPVANWVFLGQKTILLRNPNSGDAACGARIRRISVQGIGLLHDREIPVGEEFTLLLPRQDAQPVTVRCAAVRCEAGCDGLYRIGAIFTAVLSEEYAGGTHSHSLAARPIRAATLAA